MIRLHGEFIATVSEVGDTGLTQGEYYPIIGTYHRNYEKDGQTKEQDLYILLKDDGTTINVFPSKCRLKRKFSSFQ